MNVDAVLESTGTAVTIVDVSPAQAHGYVLITYMDASNDLWIREISTGQGSVKLANSVSKIDEVAV